MNPVCEVCEKPLPDDPYGWGKDRDSGGEDAGWMYFCPECMAKWEDTAEDLGG